MGPIASVVVYIIVWWLVFLCALPFGHAPQKDRVLGAAQSAPEHPKLGKKAIITSLITLVIWVVVYVMIDMRVLSFRDMAAQMPR